MSLPLRDDRPGRPRQNRAGRFLVWLSGADVDTLARCGNERRKFVGLGGVVLTTAGLAAVSATFALSTAARAPLWFAAVVGLCWGIAIMNLDRWLVSATPRRDRWWQNLTLALPRLFMALVIGIVISTPLVLWLFQRELNTELERNHQTKVTEFQHKLDTQYAKIPELEKHIAELRPTADGTAVPAATDPTVAALEAEYRRLDEEYQAKLKEANAELDGSGGSRRSGAGPIYNQKIAQANEIKTRLDDVGQRLAKARDAAAAAQTSGAAAAKQSAADKIAADQAELDRLKQQRLQDEANFKADERNDEGLLARLNALSSLTRHNQTMQWSHWFLLAFITLIEVLPVLAKFLMNVGPASSYDTILGEAERADVDTALAELGYRRQLARTEFDERARREEAAVSEVVDRMVEVEKSIYHRVIDRWEADRRQEVDDNVESFVRTRPRRRPKPRAGEYDAYPGPEPARARRSQDSIFRVQTNDD